MPAPSFPVPVTALFSSLSALSYAQLAMNVIKLRVKNRVPYGDGGHEDLERAIRAHGNYGEYYPVHLIQLALMELNGAPRWLLFGLGGSMGLGRLFHYWSVSTDASNAAPTNWRVWGMRLTLGTIITGAFANLALAGKVLAE
ncbi:glutathione S-transfersae-related protein [Hyaloraphidium curvatum]|nr:glutathione S-transfersae-related protein [Hyaloraphidium curvatum]